VADFPAQEFALDGEPGAIKGSAKQWLEFGSAATDAAGQIRSLDSSLFIGPEGDQYRQGLNQDLPPHLDVTGAAYTKVGNALNTFADALTGLQQRMSPLRVKAPSLWEAMQEAGRRLSAAQSADQQHAAKLANDMLTRSPVQPAPPDNYHSDTGAATASLSNAQQAWNDNLAASQAVKTDVKTAVDSAVNDIKSAADSRFAHNPSGFGALVAGFENFVKDHVAGLAKLSGVLKLVSGICGILSFVPVIDVVAAPLALATGAAALAIDMTIKGVTGQGPSWGQLIVDGALIALPMVGKLAPLARTTTLVKEADDGTQVVIKTQDMFIRTKVSISAGDEEFSQILPKGTQVRISNGSLSSGPDAPLARAVDRSTAPYAYDGVRVSRSVEQNQLAARTVERLQAANADDIRVDQAQVNSVGEKVGGNRPDVQGSVGGQGVQRVHFEYDRPGLDGSMGSRAIPHAQTILGDDPNSIVVLVPSGPPG
jgi:hypothetical protein